MKINESRFLITGCNRGIGRSVAKMAAQKRAHLYLANRSLDPELENELLDLGALSVKSFQSDLQTFAGVQNLCEQIQEIELDIIFNNAGQLTGGLIENQPIEEIYAMLQVNVNALIHLSRAVVPGFVKRGRGKIINHASVSSYMHFPAASTYSASKAAVAAFTECLRAELVGTGVTTLLLVTPGVDTRMYRDIPNKYGQNLDMSFLRAMSPEKYAGKIGQAIEQDLDVLLPQGSSGLGLSMAKHLPGVFQKLVSTKFKRS